MRQDDIIALLHAPLGEAWAPPLAAGLKALARLSGGRPNQILVLPEPTAVVDVRGLWPRQLTLDGQVFAPLTLWPLLTATVTLVKLPVATAPVDRLVRQMLTAYTQALRDVTQQPAALAPHWPLVRALYNHLLVLQTALHQWRLAEAAPGLTLGLYGPVAQETERLAATLALPLERHPVMAPWREAYVPDLTAMLPAVTKGRRQGVVKATSAQQREVQHRAKHLRRRQFDPASHPVLRKAPQPVGATPDHPSDYTVFDLEFSSGNAQEGIFITEIGAVKVRAGQLVDTFNAFVKVPRGKQLNFRSQAMTGIRAELLARYGVSPNRALTDFTAFVGADALLGFSVQGGDLPVLERQFGVTVAPGRLLDVASLAQQQGPMPGPPELSLSRYRQYLGLSLLAHGAIYDAVTTFALYSYLNGHPQNPEALVLGFTRLFAQTSLKYKGR